MRSLVFAAVLAVLAGCDARVERFEPNRVFALALANSRSTPTEVAMRDTASVVDQLFGSPDQPKWPEELLGAQVSALVDPANLARAAGPVSSDEDGTHRGLYREHCVTCHGLSGSGAGPASMFQNPYPRDFRHGVFKWKSTERPAKPTRQDLSQLLKRGVPGTAMPSFALLHDDDVEALVDYVVYLSIRGEVERRMMSAALELGYEETAPEDDLRLVSSGSSEGSNTVADVTREVAGRWTAAADRVVPVPVFAELDASAAVASIERGREIFHGQIANCAGCHGPDGNGHLETLDFDDWTKEFSTGIGLTPNDREAMRPFRDAGALRPRPIKPRTLQSAVFQGSGDPQTLYRRVTQGIAGTPMPAVARVEDNADQAEAWKGLTDSQIWDLVRYVRSLAMASGT